MNPIAFHVGNLAIRWYGVIISMGTALGLLLAMYNCKIREASYDEFINMFLIAFPSAIIGARLYYVIFEFEDYRDNLINIFNTRQGGLAIHGGIIFGVLAVYIYLKYRKESFFEYVDVAAPSIILGQAIGRWGNFFNSEAHGGPVTKEFISKFPQFIQNGMFIEGTYYHPTFLYESIWNFIICIFLIYLLKKTKKKGIVFMAYIGLYSLGRFFIEGLRTDSLYLGSIRVAQLISVLGIILSIFFIYNIIKKEKRY
ncbi:prolipoprotein diacylglyceryl transferase [Clostridium botulinum]|uniref:prolipoprotein diacylglyceryl transferase n=1 Tax=Clostridium botulinum TaxID=1491 RepID=UPI000A1725D2|nr:prolipoprotein diacylglyceryl transferase [Clostridium botulinum]AUN19111.1 prolipoprotein diacylglyceryl transferase [Clostridium botulinum]OSA83412.1 prolipoprotein diacylglyceryl transferase [Clostridium botulinum]